MKQTIFFAFILFFAQTYAQQHSSFNAGCEPYVQVPPLERFTGRMDISDTRYGNPYTTFVKDVNFDLNIELIKIRTNITYQLPAPRVDSLFASNPYLKYYKEIKDYIDTTSMPCECAVLKACEHPKWTKANAFIYLLGIQLSLDSSNRLHASIMPDSIRNYYGKRAYDGITHLNPQVQNCYAGIDCGKVRQQAMNLVQYLQAYDYLKTGGYIQPLDGDMNKDFNFRTNEVVNLSPRNCLRGFARNLYKSSDMVINSKFGWKKNHGIICASALYMAAIVLNDAGVEYRPVIGTLKWVIGRGPFPHPSYSPKNWFDRAVGTEGGRRILIPNGEDGIEDNFFVGHHILAKDVPQSNADGTSGFAEGTNYFTDLSRAFLPCLRTAANYLSKDHPKNFLYVPKYRNILKWCQDLLIYDNSLPNIDNGKLGSGSFLGVLGDAEFNQNRASIPGLGDNVDLRADMIIAQGFTPISVKENLFNPSAGVHIVHNITKTSQHYLIALSEIGYAIDKAATFWDESHEDDDLGSFQIYASNLKGPAIPAVLDCNYFGSEDMEYTNKYLHHNVAMVNSTTFGTSKEYIFETSTPIFYELNGAKTSFNLGIKFEENLIGLPVREGLINRQFEVFNIGDQTYYLVEDRFDIEDDYLGESLGGFDSVMIQVNGNGRDSYLETYKKVGNLSRWTLPCRFSGSDNWGLTAHFAGLKGGIQGSITSEIPFTLNSENGTKSSGTISVISNVLDDDYITRLQFSQPIRRTIFHSFLYPQKCGDSLPTVIKRDTFENKLVTEIDFIKGVDTSFDARLGKSTFALAKDTVSHVHLVKWLGGADSLSNPFNRANQAFDYLFFDGPKLFLENHTLSYMGVGFGYCPPSYINLRKFIAYNSSYLIFKDTLFHSTIGLDFDYSVTGKNNYTCQISTKTTPSSTDTLKLKLPEVGRGIDMVALIAGTKDTLHGRYDSLSNYIYLALKPGNYAINIEPYNPCLDCYFPPNGTDFDTLFIANSKNHHTLGNSKKINANHGNLSIVNSTKVNMCAGVILHNKDSLIIEGPAQKEKRGGSSCAGIDSLIKGSDNSMLIVSPYSALVLDAGSHTYVKNGAGLYIKQNGSLIVKSGALLEVGDSGTGGWGEIIAEPGAFIYIEDNAVIRYRHRIGDTSDNNTINFAVGSGGVIAGVQFYIDSILKADTILPAITYPIAICALDTINPIGNRHWGYTNFGRPEAKFFTRSLTLCPKEPFYIKLNRLLNDAQLEISVCRVDSVWGKNQDGNWHWKDTCINDSIVLDSMPPDPSCLALS